MGGLLRLRNGGGGYIADFILAMCMGHKSHWDRKGQCSFRSVRLHSLPHSITAISHTHYDVIPALCTESDTVEACEVVQKMQYNAKDAPCLGFLSSCLIITLQSVIKPDPKASWVPDAAWLRRESQEMVICMHPRRETCLDHEEIAEPSQAYAR